MFDLEDCSWDVDEEANKLSSKLFGQKQKTKKKGNSERIKKSFVNLPDSDDEVFSKKGKRKLKEKSRKQKKSSKESSENADSLENDAATSDVECSTQEPAHKKKKRKKVKNEIPDTEVVLENQTKSASPEKDLTKKKKRKVVESGGEGEEQENQILKKKKLSKDDLENFVESPEKKKRKRKKKNNCRNNKYKHLSLGSQTNKLKTGNELETTDGDNQSDFNCDNSIESEQHSKGLFVRALVEDKVEEVLNVEMGSKNTDSSNKLMDVPNKENSVSNVGSTVDDLEDLALSKSHGKKNKKKKDDIEIIETNDEIQKMNSDIDTIKKKKKKKKDTVVLKEGGTVTVDKNENNVQFANDEKWVEKKEQFKSETVSKIDNTKKKNNKNKKNKNVQNEEASLTVDKNANGVVKEQFKSKTVSETNKSKLLHKREILTKMLNESLTKPALETTNNDTTDEINESVDNKDQSKDTKQSKESFVNSIWGKASILAKEKLDSARFRFINEQLYTCEGSDALKMFRSDKQSFHVYHEGYRTQVSKWQVNPLDVIIKQFASKPNSLVVADFGCGEAKLAESIPQKVHSFDLVALNKRVTACDMSRTPLSPGSVDVAVFCLSLMGTNLVDYIREANRVLKDGGLLKVAEVTSRFTGVTSFISAVCDQGFQILNKRELTQMFYLMDFKKTKTVKKSSSKLHLNPCVYKRR